jgi:hypothetical protein
LVVLRCRQAGGTTLLPGLANPPRTDSLDATQVSQASQQSGLRFRVVPLANGGYQALLDLISGSTAESRCLPPSSRQANALRSAIPGRCGFEDSDADQFRDCLGRCLLGHSHAAGQFRDGSLRLNQVLDDIAVALANALESSRCHPPKDQFVDTQAKKETAIRQVQLEGNCTFGFHNHGCVLYREEVTNMLIEELFSRGIMTMGVSRIDPERQVGTFNSEFVSRLPGLRESRMEQFRWLAGEWNYENHVPATRCSPAYIDVGSTRFSCCESGTWICRVTPNGRETPHITFDPFSGQWVYLLIQGSYGILRSPEGWTGDQIVFSGWMTMLGIDCEWRMTWTKSGEDQFGFVNHERKDDGSWEYIDEWRFDRKR